jgi:soluble P-type ATPase
MITIDIPGTKTLRLEHAVFDYNGTLACDGQLLPGVGAILMELSASLQLHVITADTFGSVGRALEGVPCQVVVIGPDGQDVAKRDYVRKIGPHRTASFGNGRNDCLMLRESVIGVAVISEEGAAAQTLAAADVVCHSATSALELLTNPLRLVATLRC